ncbi:MAG: T9SS type A sorting domain-containing protein [Balneolia bacterium]|nr:T9SS type A sorting domain-containing protein [Balneolia bacterium]
MKPKTKSPIFIIIIVLFVLTLSGLDTTALGQQEDPLLYHYSDTRFQKTNLATQTTEVLGHAAPEMRMAFYIAEEDSFIVWTDTHPRNFVKTNNDFSSYRYFSDNLSSSPDNISFNSDYSMFFYFTFFGIYAFDIESGEESLLYERDEHSPEASAYYDGNVYFIKRTVENGSLINGFFRLDMNGETELITDLDLPNVNNLDLFINNDGKVFVVHSLFSGNTLLRFNHDGSDMQSFNPDHSSYGSRVYFDAVTSKMFYDRFQDGDNVFYYLDLMSDTMEETELFTESTHSPSNIIYNPNTDDLLYNAGEGLVLAFNMDTEAITQITSRMPDNRFFVDEDNGYIYFNSLGTAARTDLEFNNLTYLYEINYLLRSIRYFYEEDTQHFYYYRGQAIHYFNVNDENPEPSVLVETNGNVAHDFEVDYSNNTVYMYTDGSAIYSIDISTGEMTSLADNPRHVHAIAYNPDRDEVVFGSNQWIYRVSADGEGSSSIFQLLDGTINNIQYVPAMGGYVYRENRDDDYKVFFGSADPDGEDRVELFSAPQINHFYLLSDGDVGTSANPEPEIAGDISLEQNYPNPFNPTTAITYTLPEASEVRLEVFNLMGQRVAVLEQGSVSAGSHTVSFDAGSLASGMYIYRLQAGSHIETKKMMLVK